MQDLNRNNAQNYQAGIGRTGFNRSWLYTFNEWGEQQADKYLDDLNTAITLLANQPLACRERTELEPPVRIHHHGHHLIVYLALADGINLVRFLHESMDVDSHLDDSEAGQ